MRIVVTGANGLVGSRLCAQLVARGHQVHGLSRGPLRVVNRGWTYTSVELTDSNALRETLGRQDPEVIVNPASMTDVDGCERDPAGAFAANVQVPATLALEAAKRSAHLVHFSTDYVFDGEAGPYAEDALPNPKGVYALTKHMGEQAVRALCTSWAIARTAVVYGWPAAGRANFGSWLVSSLAGGTPVRLFSDQYVSASLALNVAEMVAELSERRLDGTWHLCGATVVNRVEFARVLCERFGLDFGLVAPSRLADAKLASPRPARSGLRVDKAKRNLVAQPLTLTDAIERFFAEWKAA